MKVSVFSLCVAAVACHSGSPPEEHALPDAGGTTATSASSAPETRHRRPREADAGLDALCATILKEEKLQESALREEDRASPGPRLRCWSTGAFAWAIRAEKIGAGPEIRRTILFASSAGARARLAATVQGIEWPPVIGRHAGLHDFDGDGTPELVATIAKDVRSYAPGERIFVTMKKGAIAPYPTGGKFLVDGMTDADHDGKPDLRVSFDLGKATVCAPTDEARVEVEFLAHTLANGTFSVDDAVATGWAQKRCPAMPASDGLFAPSEGPAAGARDLSLSYVACERMRGKSAADVIAELGAACAPNADETKTCAGPCRHLPDAIAVANFAPPVQLK